MWDTKNDLKKSVRTSMIELLQARLADTLDLWSQAKQAHWSIKGPSFIALHELFDQVADSVDGAADMIAERIVQLGGHASGTARAVAKQSSLKEFPDAEDQKTVVEALSNAIAATAKATREAIDTADKAGDAATADLFTEIVRDLDKYLWFVQAHNA